MDQKRKDRQRQTAEFFTPPVLVREMIDKLLEYEPTQLNPEKTLCDPAMGNGNIIIEVLKKRIEMGFDPIKSLETLYGADIMQDNMHEARVRILKYLKEIGVEITIYLIKLVLKNFFCTPLDKYKNGSLDYDFEFNHEIQEDEVERLSKEINEISHDNTEPTI